MVLASPRDMLFFFLSLYKQDLISTHFLFFLLFNYRLGFISQWGALAGRYAALCPPGWPWTSSQASQISAANATAHRMPFHSPSNGECCLVIYSGGQCFWPPKYEWVLLTTPLDVSQNKSLFIYKSTLIVVLLENHREICMTSVLVFSWVDTMFSDGGWTGRTTWAIECLTVILLPNMND